MAAGGSGAHASARETRPRGNPLGRRRSRWLFAAFLLLSAAVRLPDVWRPIDGSTWSPWRESDVGSIARNFYREDGNILRPRIDWRGDGPGFVESEFPIYPWTVSLLYRAFGYHEQLARTLSFTISLLSAGVFFLLARHLLPPVGLVAALLFFAFNPMAIQTARAVQPEPSMLLFSLLGIYAFLRWIDEEHARLGVLAAGATAFAILAKAPAAHIGLLFAAICLDRYGLPAVQKPRLWLFAAGALVPPAIWYAFSHQYWLEYGNSLGVSNATISPITSARPFWMVSQLLPSLGTIELSAAIWTVPGALLAATALPLVGTWPGRVVLYWLGALGIYFVATINITGELWASYYHIVTVPAAALAIGLAFGFHTRSLWRTRRFALRGALAVALLGAAIGLQLKQLRWQTGHEQWASSYACAQQFQQHVPEGTLIAASGGQDFDRWGNPAPGDAPQFFFWMDRQGFSIHEPEHTIARLEEVRARGARFFVAERFALTRDAPEQFEEQLRQHYRLVSECEVAMLFELGAPSVAGVQSSSPESSLSR